MDKRRWIFGTEVIVFGTSCTSDFMFILSKLEMLWHRMF